MEKLKYWMPVDWYNGGMEHVTRHLIYSRFWHRFLYDIGVVPCNLEVIAAADWIIDLGPGSGSDGGRVIFEGTPAQLLECRGSFTAEALRREIGCGDPAIG